MNRPLLVVLGLLLGVLGTLLIVRFLAVPPPAFTGASFGNSAPKRSLKSAAVHYWLVPGKVPKDDAQRRDWEHWVGNTAVPLAQHPENAQYAATDSVLNIQNIVTVALVVIVTNSESNADETYINFLSDSPTDPTKFGIHHLNAWLAIEKKDDPIKLVVDYFYGDNAVYYPSLTRRDDTSYGP